MRPGSPLEGLYDAQGIVAQHAQVAQAQLNAAQKSGDPAKIKAAQDQLTDVQETAKNLDTTILNGFTDQERNAYAKQKQAEQKQDSLDEQNAKRDAETARHNRSEEALKAAEQTGGPNDTAKVGQFLSDATMDPSQLSKRSKSYNASLIAADDHSWAAYGKPFNIAQAQTDYKYANNRSTQDTLKMINAITDKNGSLDLAMQASQGLPQLDEQTMNKVFNRGKQEFGSAGVSNFHTAMLGLADEYAQVMGKGQTSDIGRQQALDLLKDAYSKGQMTGAAGYIKKDLAARFSATVGNNRYLQNQLFGPSGISTTMVAPDGKTKMEVPGSKVEYYKSKGAHIQTKQEYQQSLAPAQ
jgi:hypothetical protein